MPYFYEITDQFWKMHDFQEITDKLENARFLGDNGFFLEKTPNILIDDRTKIIQQWQQAGGYGIKFQADEDSLNVVKQGLDSFYFNKEG